MTIATDTLNESSSFEGWVGIPMRPNRHMTMGGGGPPGTVRSSPIGTIVLEKLGDDWANVMALRRT